MSHLASPLCQAAILVGGMGTRLRARVGDIPKPMALLHGRPVLEHQIELCRRHGITRIALLAGYKHEAIQAHFLDGRHLGVDLTYSIEYEPRGTAGALFDALPVLADQFHVLYGDTFADFDLRAMLDRHIASNSDATLFLHPNDHPSDSDLVSVDASGRVSAVNPYPHGGDLLVRNLVNAALYVFSKSAVSPALEQVGRADIAKHAIPAMLERGCQVSGYISPEYIKDMGTPERLDKVAAQIDAGLPDRLSSRILRSAVFLDRDGTINVEVGHLANPEQVALISGSAQAIRALNRQGLLAVAVTNQPVLARGDTDLDGLEAIHARLDHELGREGAYLDRLYFCPHHPDTGFEREVPELKLVCDCRKPATGMIDQAVKDLNIDRRSSWMVGDATSDILAGKRAGLRTILVGTGQGGRDGKFASQPDYRFADLEEAVHWIIDGRHDMMRKFLPLSVQLDETRLMLLSGEQHSQGQCAAQIISELAALTGRSVHRLDLSSVSANDEVLAEISSLAQCVDSTAQTYLPFASARTALEHTNVTRVAPRDLIVVNGFSASAPPAPIDGMRGYHPLCNRQRD